MKTVIYHNPRCSKSRATLSLLQEKGVEPTIVNYLEAPLTKLQLQTLCNLLDRKPKQIIRFSESVAKDKGFKANDDRSAEEWLGHIADNPILLERPIVVVDDQRAVIGRPPENVLSII